MKGSIEKDEVGEVDQVRIWKPLFYAVDPGESRDRFKLNYMIWSDLWLESIFWVTLPLSLHSPWFCPIKGLTLSHLYDCTGLPASGKSSPIYPPLWWFSKTHICSCHSFAAACQWTPLAARKTLQFSLLHAILSQFRLLSNLIFHTSFLLFFQPSFFAISQSFQEYPGLHTSSRSPSLIWNTLVANSSLVSKNQFTRQVPLTFPTERTNFSPPCAPWHLVHADVTSHCLIIIACKSVSRARM